VAKNTSNPPNAPEQQKAQRWQYPDVGHSSESKKGGIGILTAEKLEAIQKQAYQQAYNEGYAEGFNKGHQEGKQTLSAMHQQLNEAISLVQQPLRDLDQAVLNQIFELVVSIARQLVKREIKTDPGEIVAVIRDAIKLLPVSSNKINIALHPEDNALLKELFKSSQEAEQWRLIDDISLQRGDCKVTTNISSIDASLENRLMSVVNKIWGGEREGDKS